MMSQPLQPTEEQIAAAQLRIVLDEKLGRQTPELVRQIAAMTNAESPEQQPSPSEVAAIRELISGHEPQRSPSSYTWAARVRAEEIPHGTLPGALSLLWDDPERLPEPERAPSPRSTDLVAIAHREVTILNNLGDVQQRLGRPEDAAKSYQEALTIVRKIEQITRSRQDE